MVNNFGVSPEFRCLLYQQQLTGYIYDHEQFLIYKMGK